MFVITDCRIRKDILSALKQRGFESILLPPSDYLQKGVASHADMLIFLGWGKIFCHKRYYEANRELIQKIASRSASELVLSDEPTGEQYPLDVLFNACLVGEKLICNEKTVSPLLLGMAKKHRCETVNVLQGYTKCSVCAVSENAVITADRGIATACRAAGIDTLTISEGHVSLPPYDYGFIGGTSGSLGNKVFFCGSLDTHPDGEKIKRFCEKHEKTAVSLTKGELQDIGSLFFIGE